MLISWEIGRREIVATGLTIAETAGFRLNGAGEFLERFHGLS
jgi:hypothetical protein